LRLERVSSARRLLRRGDACALGEIHVVRFGLNGMGYLRSMEAAGKLLLGAALVLAILGVGALVLSKLGIGQLPGTLAWRSENVTVFVPIGLMLLVSVVGTILLNVFLRR